jgi:hypothetical protein
MAQIDPVANDRQRLPSFDDTYPRHIGVLDSPAPLIGGRPQSCSPAGLRALGTDLV